MSSASAVKPGTAGGVLIAPTTATLPTDATTAAGDSFLSVGHISTDGVKRNISHDTETVKDWNGDDQATLDKGKTETLEFTMIDSADLNALKVIYGDSNVTGSLTAGIVAKSTGDMMEAHEFVVNMIRAEKVLERLCVPKGIVTEIGEITYASESVVSYDVTITCMADSAGVTVYDYIAQGS